MTTLYTSKVRSRGGFTLLESTIALAATVSLGYSLVLVLGVGGRSERTILKVAAEDQGFREAVKTLTDELRTSADSTVTVQTLPDGNHALRFMVPIVAAGVVTWGVHDSNIASDAAGQDQPGWSLRYTVRTQVTAGGATVRELVRQVLDGGLAVQREQVLARGLRSGAQSPQGFRVVKSGAVWEVTLTTEGEIANKGALGAVFHVRTRN